MTRDAMFLTKGVERRHWFGSTESFAWEKACGCGTPGKLECKFAERKDERLKVLARFIRNQASLADRPPPGCIQLNNDEALLCADALEHLAKEREGSTS